MKLEEKKNNNMTYVFPFRTNLELYNLHIAKVELRHHVIIKNEKLLIREIARQSVFENTGQILIPILAWLALTDTVPTLEPYQVSIRVNVCHYQSDILPLFMY